MAPMGLVTMTNHRHLWWTGNRSPFLPLSQIATPHCPRLGLQLSTEAVLSPRMTFPQARARSAGQATLHLSCGKGAEQEGRGCAFHACLQRRGWEAAWGAWNPNRKTANGRGSKLLAESLNR